MRDSDTPKSALRLARELAMINLGLSSRYESRCEFIKCCDELSMKQLEGLREKLLRELKNGEPDILFGSKPSHMFKLDCVETHIKTRLFDWYMLLKKETIVWESELLE